MPLDVAAKLPKHFEMSQPDSPRSGDLARKRAEDPALAAAFSRLRLSTPPLDSPSPSRAPTMIESLPPELLLHILETAWKDTPTLLHASLVSRSWRAAAWTVLTSHPNLLRFDACHAIPKKSLDSIKAAVGRRDSVRCAIMPSRGLAALLGCFNGVEELEVAGLAYGKDWRVFAHPALKSRTHSLRILAAC